MKNLALIFVLILASVAFGQSKKTINKELKLQLEEVKRLNDSISVAVSDQLKYQAGFRNNIAYFEENTKRKQREIDELDQKIKMIKVDLIHFGYDPEQLVSEKDLLAIYSLQNRVFVIDGVVNPSNLIKVEDITDISTEKIKMQNQLLASKISEYKLANENNTTVLQQQKDVSKEVIHEKEMANEQFELLIRVNLMLEKKYSLLRNKQIELEKKNEEDRLKALEEAKKKPTQKSTSTIKFIPPVIVDEEPTMNVNGSSDTYVDVVPPPPPPISEINYPKALENIDIVEEPAEFPGGYSALKLYIQNNLKYPEKAVESGIQGKVWLKFIVSKTGEISNVQLKRGIVDCPECDQEAIRLVTNMPNWNPGKDRGIAVSSYYNLPIVFKLDQ